MLLSLKEARELARTMGLDDKAISRLRLRPNMEESAVGVMVNQTLLRMRRKHPRSAKAKKPTEKLHLSDLGLTEPQNRDTRRQPEGK